MNILVVLVLILLVFSEYKSSGETEECPPNKLKCYDNSTCIESAYWCDKWFDCPDSSDELYCTCKDRISVQYHCDGVHDCPNGEDEIGCFGCDQDSFSCFEGTDDLSKQQCVSLSQRCDGIWNCENGRDEKDCHLLRESYVNNADIVSVGYSSGYLFKNWYGKWYPVCSSSWIKAVNMWAHSACSSEVGRLTSQPTIKMVPVRRGLGLFISQTKTGKIQIQQDCGGQAVFVKCPVIPCGSTAPEASTSEILVASRIFGGKKSKPHAWPYIVAIHSYYRLFINCSGTIIDEKWILTAAHCVDSHPKNYYRIYAGLIRHHTWSPMTQTRRVEFVIRHPNFNPLTGANDIALMKLDEPLKFNRYVRNLCLPLPTWGTIPAVHEICTVIGWGISIQNGEREEEELREVELPIFDKCNDSTICTYEREKDACKGDSGGPLMCQIPNSNRLYIAGIVNREENNNPCGHFDAAGVYARVSFHYPWIKKTMNLDSRSFGFKLLEHCPGYECYGEDSICYNSDAQCNNYINCWTGIDEFENCSRNLPDELVNRDNKYSMIKWNSEENVDHFICTDVTQTIPRSLRCDKKIDCEDGSDELNCRCTDILYIKHPLSICNGRIDCADKTDELNCHDRRNENNTYLCTRSAVIIPAEKRCNGIRDCQLSDDEIDCYALTNGSHIELDIEGSTVLKINGIVSVNRNNTWTIKCFRNTIKLADEANKYCNILGFGNYKSISPLYIDARILKGYTSSKNSSITFNHYEVIKSILQSRHFGDCFALFIECQMSFKNPLSEYLYESNWTNEETYLLPWEATIFVDGKYHCPVLLLDTTWALTSTRCTKDINLKNNITAVVAGLSIPYQHVNGPHEEIRIVDHIENVGQLHTTLLHFNKLPITRYIKPIFVNHAKPYLSERGYCQATGVNQKLEKKSTILFVDIVGCPKNRLICFKNSIENWCSDNDSTENWSGFVSCYNSKGWYVAAVFHEKDIFCKITDSNTFIGIDIAFHFFSDIMNKIHIKLPSAQCDVNDMQCAEGKCIPRKDVCNGIQDCRDGSDENKDNCF
ncbi:GSCOCT00003620001.2-RA-CDS [Cotesia congregata]|uniref:Putative serine protease nudel n=1 Tax=Cotesia congregata TaxID=51543 RepID=A0A8J2MG90_COTCN|nr:GSCOCT00003620001.2-RA-CDS [Cotesia congregata]CAG5077976.1 putative serine protease nudel [Cotesia congregata]